MSINKEVKNYWEEEACGTSPDLRSFKSLESICPSRLGFYLGLQVIKEDKLEDSKKSPYKL